MGQVDGFHLSVHPIFRQPGGFEIHRVPGVQYQGVHDGAGHQLNHPCVFLAGTGRLLKHFGRGWAVVILNRGHGERVRLLAIVLLVVPHSREPISW